MHNENPSKGSFYQTGLTKLGVPYVEPYPPEYIRIETAIALNSAAKLRREVHTFLFEDGSLDSGPPPLTDLELEIEKQQAEMLWAVP